MSEKITKVRLPEATEIALAAWMAQARISTMDKNVIISRAVEIYLREYAKDDGVLTTMILARSEARSERGKDAWARGSHDR
ncbi:hypothetical protein M0R72_19670 [Candidatus Pacearchaeota archaeon]|jgi:hypothetical protein|nr:hypothetical protein [Candidatus Pacearchaeota archaeon]